jgi:hypothetical protein
MKPAAGDIAAGSAILRKAGRFLPETPEGSNVCASVSLTGGRKRQKFRRVNAPHERDRQNRTKNRTTVREFYLKRQKWRTNLVFPSKITRRNGLRLGSSGVPNFVANFTIG